MAGRQLCAVLPRPRSPVLARLTSLHPQPPPRQTYDAATAKKLQEQATATSFSVSGRRPATSRAQSYWKPSDRQPVGQPRGRTALGFSGPMCRYCAITGGSVGVRCLEQHGGRSVRSSYGFGISRHRTPLRRSATSRGRERSSSQPLLAPAGNRRAPMSRHCVDVKIGSSAHKDSGLLEQIRLNDRNLPCHT